MASTPDTADRGDDATPHYFIVEVKSAAGTRIAICERIVVVSPEENGIPRQNVEDLFKNHLVRAAALVAGGGGAGTSLLGIAAAFQTGRSPLAFQTGRAPVVVDVTINNQTNGTPPPPTVA